MSLIYSALLTIIYRSCGVFDNDRMCGVVASPDEFGAKAVMLILHYKHRRNFLKGNARGKCRRKFHRFAP